MDALPDKPWGEQVVAQGKTHVLSIGTLKLHLFRRENDLLVVERRDKPSDTETVKTIVSDETAALWQKNYRRYAFNAPVETVWIRPLTPSRPVVVRPREPLHLAPGGKIDFYVSFPLDYQLNIEDAEGSVQLERGPSQILSDTWFGDSTQGHIAFAINTRAQRDRSTYTEPDWGRGVVRMSIHNEAESLLRCDKFSLRLAHCALYEGQGHIWASSVRVTYRGAEMLSSLDYATAPPPYLSEPELLSSAEEPVPGGLLRRTFGRISGGLATI